MARFFSGAHFRIYSKYEYITPLIYKYIEISSSI